MSKGNIYIAGKMRGMPEFNFPSFDTAAEILRGDGWTVFSPAERDRGTGFDPSGMTGNEDLSILGFSLREALAADTKYICEEADHIYMLDGWENSSGARAEKALAEALGHQVLYQTVDREALTPAEVSAYERGMEEGIDEGYDSGYADGHADGHGDGYHEGDSEARDEMEADIADLQEEVQSLTADLQEAMAAAHG